MKNILKFIRYLILGIVILLFPVLIQSVDPDQKKTNFEAYNFPDTLSLQAFDIDSIKNIAGKNKGLPKGFELAAGIALSAYPQLKEVKIDMILRENGAPMEASMDIFSLIGARKNRKYKVLLNNSEVSVFDPILLKSLPFDAQVGILAHELGHIAYYHELSTLEIGKWAISYLINPVFRARHEKSTDMMAVYHGLGSQIYQYAYYVRYDSSTNHLYKKYGSFFDKFYMTDKELKKVIQ